jgi:hypothetical protein
MHDGDDFEFSKKFLLIPGLSSFSTAVRTRRMGVRLNGDRSELLDSTNKCGIN